MLMKQCTVFAVARVPGVAGVLAQCIRSSMLKLAVFVILTTAAFAQVRLYDPVNDDLAKRTRDAFAEFSKGDSSIFETMTRNTLALKSATLTQLYDLNEQCLQDKINLIPTWTWTKLASDVESTQQDFLDAYHAAEMMLDTSMTAPPDAKSALNAAQDRLKKMQAEKEESEKKFNHEVPQLAKLKSSLQDLKDGVAASAKPVKKLSDLAQFKSLKDAWDATGDIKDWFTAAEKAEATPGLQLTILDLGIQHKQFEVQRLQLEFERADAAYKIEQRISQRLQMVWGDGSMDPSGKRLNGGLFAKIYANITITKKCTEGPDTAGTSGQTCLKYPFVSDPSEQVLQTAGKLARKANAEVGKEPEATLELRDLMDTLSRYASLIGYHKYLLLSDTIEAATDKHLFAIRLSALNTQDREMLVSHGLDGLAAYYAGGVKPEEIANFFRAAQVAATGVLAGRTK